MFTEHNDEKKMVQDIAQKKCYNEFDVVWIVYNNNNNNNQIDTKFPNFEIDSLN